MTMKAKCTWLEGQESTEGGPPEGPSIVCCIAPVVPRSLDQLDPCGHWPLLFYAEPHMAEASNRQTGARGGRKRLTFQSAKSKEFLPCTR